MNKNIYLKKIHFFSSIILASFSFIIAILILVFLQRIIEIGYSPKSRLQFYYILWSIIALLQFISAYQIDKLPNIVFKDDEIIQYISVFRIKEKIKLNDIKDFEIDLYFFRKAVIFTLNNNKIKRLSLIGISIADQEYIINFLKERIASDKNSKSIDSTMIIGEIMNKEFYFKKGHRLFYLFYSLFWLLIVFAVFQNLSILQTLLVYLLCIGNIILTYQVFNLPYIIFKDDEIIQYIGVFRIKKKIKIIDITDYETGAYLFEKGLIFNLKNDKIKRLRLGGLSKSDREYIINLLQERIA